MACSYTQWPEARTRIVTPTPVAALRPCCVEQPSAGVYCPAELLGCMAIVIGPLHLHSV